MQLNELIKIEQQATNATQKLEKVKEYYQMISKHYKRTPTITAMIRNSNEK